MFKKQKKAIKLVKNPSKIIREEKKSKINWGGGLGIALSVIGLVYTVKQFEANREHQKLSVRPVLAMVSHYDVEGKKVGLFIENYGEGAAIIQQINVYIDDKKFEHFEETGWLPIIEEFNIHPLFLKLGRIRKNSRVKKDAQDWFIWRAPTESKCAVLQTQSFFADHKIEFEIFYTDAYEEQLVEKLSVNFPKDFEEIFKYGFNAEINSAVKQFSENSKKIQEIRDKLKNTQVNPSLQKQIDQFNKASDENHEKFNGLIKNLNADKVYKQFKKDSNQILEETCLKEFFDLAEKSKNK